MSLPSESVFKCAGHSSSESDRLIVDYGNEDHLYLSTIEHGEGRSDVILSKDQVKSLRDQLTAWLAGNNQECMCDMRTKLVGDGCAVCNPERAKDLEEAQ